MNSIYNERIYAYIHRYNHNSLFEGIYIYTYITIYLICMYNSIYKREYIHVTVYIYVCMCIYIIGIYITREFLYIY